MRKPQHKARMDAWAKRYDKAVALKEKGYTYAEIAELIGGMSRQRAHRLVTGKRPGSV